MISWTFINQFFHFSEFRQIYIPVQLPPDRDKEYLLPQKDYLCSFAVRPHPWFIHWSAFHFYKIVCSTVSPKWNICKLVPGLLWPASFWESSVLLFALKFHSFYFWVVFHYMFLLQLTYQLLMTIWITPSFCLLQVKSSWITIYACFCVHVIIITSGFMAMFQT